MIRFLTANQQSNQLARPLAVTSGPRQLPGTAGAITPSFQRGSLTLKSQQGQFYRLSWEDPPGAVDPASRLRAVPAGEYSLIGYRILRQDDKKREWMISSTSPHGIRRLVLKGGETQVISIPDHVTIQFKARLSTNSLNLQVMVQGDHHAGASIYKDGKRIPIEYHVTSNKGRLLAKGSMEYG